MIIRSTNHKSTARDGNHFISSHYVKAKRNKEEEEEWLRRTSVSSPTPTRHPIRTRAGQTVQKYSTKGAQVPA